MNLLKITLLSLGLTFSTQGTAQIVGMLGGEDGTQPYASYVYPNPPTASLLLFPPFPGADISSVAINQLNQGIAGGVSADGAAYLALTTPSSSVTMLSGLPASPSQLNTVSINDFGYCVVGGVDNSAAYAAFVNPNSNTIFPISNLPLTNPSAIQSVAINGCGVGLIGGSDNTQAYAAFVSSNSQSATPISGLPNSGIAIHSVAINTSGQGLIGGDDNVSSAYAAALQPATTEAIPISISGVELINSVAINDSGLGLIGGLSADGSFAAYVDPSSHALIPISNATFSQGYINAVALNASGQGIIGGTNESMAAYAAYVDPHTHAAGSQIANLPTGFSSVIETVAINEFGQALVAGFDELHNPYAAYVDPATQTATLISNLPSPVAGSIISSVAMPYSPRIPTSSLTGNHLNFANYINQNAPRSVLYFLPAICSGSLDESLESAAPTRNAFSLYAADKNLFILNHGLSDHLRNHYLVKKRILQKSGDSVTRNGKVTDQLLVFSDNLQQDESLKSPTSPPLERSDTLWFEGIGAFTFQKAQEQTVGFDPFVGGFIFGFDKKVTQNSLAGAGLAYTFTEISEDHDQGHSNINQEYLFGYASWAESGLYVDGALWWACFQTHQVRNIHTTGFSFTATSNPIGIQLAPHFELGYNWETRCLINPFVRVDWANAWQFSYQEKGTSPFNASQNSHYSSLLRTEAGLRFYEEFSFSSWRLILEEKGSYVNTASFGVGRVNAFLIGSPGTFTVETLTDPQNLGVIELSCIYDPLNLKYPYTSFSYQGEFGSSFQSHQLTAEASWDF